MPPRPQPKVYQLQLKTHKLTIFLTLPPTTTVAEVKAEAFSALTADVNQVEDVPKITRQDEFELCRAIRDKGRSTGEYEELRDGSRQLKDMNLTAWDVLFLQFRDQDTGALVPVTFTQPSVEDEEEDMSAAPSEAEYPIPGASKGKRKRTSLSDD